MTAWDQPRARRALSLRLREGLTAGPTGAELLDAIEQTLAQRGDLFAAWRQQGLVRAPEHLSPRQLARELLARWPTSACCTCTARRHRPCGAPAGGWSTSTSTSSPVFGTAPDGQATTSKPERSG